MVRVDLVVQGPWLSPKQAFPLWTETRRVLCEWTQLPSSMGCTRNLRVTPAAPDSSDKVTCTPWLVLSWLSLLVDQSSATSPFTPSFRDYTQSCCCCVWVFSFTRCKIHNYIIDNKGVSKLSKFGLNVILAKMISQLKSHQPQTCFLSCVFLFPGKLHLVLPRWLPPVINGVEVFLLILG